MLQQGTQFQWEPTATFSLTSEQFGKLYNVLTGIISTPGFQKKMAEAQETMAIADLQSTMNNVLENAVQAGIATEVVSETTDTSAGSAQ
jgi:hypothetical protein